MKKRIIAAGLVAFAATTATSFAWTNAFTVDFQFGADATNWNETRSGQTDLILESGETSPQGVAYTPAPDADAGFPNNGWFRFGRSSNTSFGVTFLRPSGIQGGDSTIVPVNYEVSADVFVVDGIGTRYDIGLFVRSPVAGTGDPLRIYYANGANPSVPKQFGFRGTTQGNNQAAGNPTITGNQWVRMRARVQGDQLTYGFDLNRDGTEESTATVTIANPSFAVDGYPGLFVVTNDQNAGSVGVPNSFGYFDNFTYTPLSASVDEWMNY